MSTATLGEPLMTNGYLSLTNVTFTVNKDSGGNADTVTIAASGVTIFPGTSFSANFTGTFTFTYMVKDSAVDTTLANSRFKFVGASNVNSNFKFTLGEAVNLTASSFSLNYTAANDPKNSTNTTIFGAAASTVYAVGPIWRGHRRGFGVHLQDERVQLYWAHI
jgi:hypothetical protein